MKLNQTNKSRQLLIFYFLPVKILPLLENLKV